MSLVAAHSVVLMKTTSQSLREQSIFQKQTEMQNLTASAPTLNRRKPIGFDGRVIGFSVAEFEASNKYQDLQTEVNTLQLMVQEDAAMIENASNAVKNKVKSFFSLGQA